MRPLKVLAFAALLLAVTCAAAPAQTYPNRLVRIVVPFAPGGPADALARVLAEKLTGFWGQSVVIENRGGAGGNIGAELAARAAPDGYTLLVNPSNHVINPSLYEKINYDPLADFTPITELASYMLVLVVHPSVPARTLKEFVAYARGQPDGLAMANASTGTPTHLTAALFAQAAGLNFIHVPYKGAAPANTDLIGGQVPAMFNNPINALPQIRAGALRPIAVTGAQRLALLPEVPTVAAEDFPGFEAHLVRAVRPGPAAARDRAEAQRRHGARVEPPRRAGKARGAGFRRDRRHAGRVRRAAQIRARQMGGRGQARRIEGGVRGTSRHRSPDAAQRAAKRNGAPLIRGPDALWTPGLQRTTSLRSVLRSARGTVKRKTPWTC